MYRQLVIKELLEKELIRLRYLERRMEKDIENLPDGSLTKRDDRIYRVVRENGKQKQLRIYENDDGNLLINQLKYRKYIKAGRWLLKEQIKLIDQYLIKSKIYDPIELMDSFGEVYQRIEKLPIFLEGDINPEEWKNKKIPDMYEKGLLHSSEGGIRTRSKSEAMIATCLERNGIPFNYEPVVNFTKGSARPDFETLVEDKRKIVYWEHLGLIDDPAYVMKNLHKLEEYAENGIYLGINLVLTYETRDNPLTFEKINEVIRKIKKM